MLAPEPSVVEHCEDLLRRARAGELRAVASALVLRETEGDSSTYHIAIGRNTFRDQLAGAVSRMLWRLHEIVQKETGYAK